ncbi:MAG: glycoside hydrolase family 95 protein [Clostridia bacterium]|nr:glycoside hydrolase family 95 protein [Clostridia bacterium]
MKNYELWYKQEAPLDGEDFVLFSHKAVWRSDEYKNDGWEKWSLPLGNGYMGVNVFGRTKSERLQITENSFCNPWTVDDTRLTCNGGLMNFCDVYLDFGHTDVQNYRRSLSLCDAVARTSYDFGGVTYTREHFTSYPDKIFATKLTASRAGALSFAVRPEIPFIAPYLLKEGDGMGRTGKVHAEGNILTFGGELEYYAIQYEGQIAVLCEGGDVIARENTIEVRNADSAVLLMAVGTNYKMESRVFMERKPREKLAPYPHPHARVSEILANAQKYSYEELRERHKEDYFALISRANVDLGGICPDMPTNELVESYRNGENERYLEELYFTYGRYLLIASSRPGTYPANLQGTWSKYASSPWSSGYWHNINIQMNYWPAFNTNLHELFLPYIDYFKAYKPLAMENADQYMAHNFPEKCTEKGTNGISIGTAAWLYKITGAPDPGKGHSGPGTGAFTAKLFTDYYEFSQDEKNLAEVAYTANREMAVFLSKALEEQEDGTLLVKYSESPEQQIDGGEYYHTKGCAFDQQMVYECYKDTIMLADKLGIEDEFIEKIRVDVQKLDPVQVGASGQIKEYREEEHYGDIGEYHHRHISHLVGLYPGTIINRNNPAWLRAAEYSLNKRGDVSTGWSTAHKLNAWARTKNGGRAHDLLHILLAECTMPNLWDSHPPFQIDGNFGGTAGIAEMLLQSHEGYVHVLPALPDCWREGSFTGLCARGGFTVCAKWQGGKATSIAVTASVGGKLKMLVGERFIEKEMAGGESAVWEL